MLSRQQQSCDLPLQQSPGKHERHNIYITKSFTRNVHLHECCVTLLVDKACVFFFIQLKSWKKFNSH